jgi:hypothetical protein
VALDVIFLVVETRFAKAVALDVIFLVVETRFAKAVALDVIFLAVSEAILVLVPFFHFPLLSLCDLVLSQLKHGTIIVDRVSRGCRVGDTFPVNNPTPAWGEVLPIWHRSPFHAPIQSGAEGRRRRLR